MELFYRSLFLLNNENSEFKEISSDDFLSGFEAVYKILKEAEAAMEEGFKPCLAVQGFFFGENEVFLRLDNAESKGRSFKTDQTIFVRARGDKTELIARENGYLVNKDGVISIYNPCRLTPDRVHLFYIIMPVSYGKENLAKDFMLAVYSPSKDYGLRSYDQELLQTRIDSSDIHIVTISMGIPPKYGRQASLIVNQSTGKLPATKKDGCTDYYSFSAYSEVQEDTVIAVKITGTEGVPGLDAFGEVIEVPENRDIPFSAGANVRAIEAGDGRIEYIADITGILSLTKTSASVSEILVVKGDVCAETGSIFYSRDVVINGDVHSLFTVTCGGNLIIKGVVENGASIECGGDLVIEKGVLGEKTRLLVKGSMEADFISEAKLRVMGDLMVHGTIYSATVFCGGELTLEGKKNKTKNRGSVVGSQITGMKGMVIHSAGSEMSKTVLICGLDQELRSQIQNMEKAIPSFDRKILRLQYKVGFDLTGEDVIERLKKLSPARKFQIKKLLEEIKMHADRKKQIETRIEKLQDRVLSPDAEKLRIKVVSHLIPEVTVKIGERAIILKNTTGPVEIVLRDNEICF